MKRMNHPVPVCCTVSRSTGEIRIEWTDSQEEQKRFGQIMNRISVYAYRMNDRACADEIRGAAIRR